MICDHCEKTWLIEANFCSACGYELRVPDGTAWRTERAARERSRRMRAEYTQPLFWLLIAVSMVCVPVCAISAAVSFATGEYWEAGAFFLGTWIAAIIFTASFICYGDDIGVPEIGVVLQTTLMMFYIVASFGSLGIVGFAWSEGLGALPLRFVVLIVAAWIISGAIFGYKRWTLTHRTRAHEQVKLL